MRVPAVLPTPQRFFCKLGEMFSAKQVAFCVEHIMDTLKAMKQRNVTQGRREIIGAIESSLVRANGGNVHVDRKIAVVVLSYADLAYAFDAGLLFFESTFLGKLDAKQGEGQRVADGQLEEAAL